ncbi:Os12g0177350 [Oryza sativa Japonica Group]|uniref:Os12g0177350 protein n=1 Tax=Oryza sativa subsp. japonica TaxID=39947 RepID=A0A0P0Y7L5_ORYSJ|nr:Os12g0177350 [Oryza sativa Japonica Group]
MAEGEPRTVEGDMPTVEGDMPTSTLDSLPLNAPSSLFSLPARGRSSCASPGMAAAHPFLTQVPTRHCLRHEDTCSRRRAARPQPPPTLVAASAWGSSSAGA